MKIKKDFKNEISAIAEILDLGKTFSSNENLQMLCPFHEENKESFGIHTHEGGYNCFACGGHGYISNLSNHLRGHIIPHYEENILEYKIKTFIDGFGYKEKPKDKIGKIVNNIEDMNVNFTDYTIHDLVALIVNGHSISPSGVKKDEDWKQQQIVMLDFDNKNTDFTREQILEYSKEISLVPTFSYYTFSHLKGEEPKEKFRFVYCFSKPITNKKQMYHILDNLFCQFKKYEPDPQCKNLARVFVGTNNTNVELSNYLYEPNTRFTEQQLNEIDSLFNNNKKDDLISANGIISITAKELIEKDLEPLNVVVENMLCAGFSILAGAPKVRKKLVLFRLMYFCLQRQIFFRF